MNLDDFDLRLQIKWSGTSSDVCRLNRTRRLQVITAYPYPSLSRRRGSIRKHRKRWAPACARETNRLKTRCALSRTHAACGAAPAPPCAPRHSHVLPSRRSGGLMLQIKEIHHRARGDRRVETQSFRSIPALSRQLLPAFLYLLHPCSRLRFISFPIKQLTAAHAESGESGPRLQQRPRDRALRIEQDVPLRGAVFVQHAIAIPPCVAHTFEFHRRHGPESRERGLHHREVRSNGFRQVGTHLLIVR